MALFSIIFKDDFFKIIFFSTNLFKVSSFCPHEHFSCFLKSVLCRPHSSPWLLPSQGSPNDLSLNWSICKCDSGIAFLVTYPSEKAKVAIRAQERFYYTFFLHIFMALPPHWYVFNILSLWQWGQGSSCGGLYIWEHHISAKLLELLTGPFSQKAALPLL